MTERNAKAAQEVADGFSEGVFASYDQTRDVLALAQMHATLALAEQQRIANLIAAAHLAEYHGAALALDLGDLGNKAIAGLVVSPKSPDSKEYDYAIVRHDIFEALGLKETSLPDNMEGH